MHIPAIQKNISLARRMHYRIGGKAHYFFEPQNARDIIAAIRWAFARNIPFLFVGAGTNMLFSEAGYDGLLMQYTHRSIRRTADGVRVSAGTSMAAVVAYYTRQGFRDLAWAGGLPGTVGGAVFGNAGCFGGETKDGVISIESIFYDHASGVIERRTRSAAECAFAYRDSIFKQNGNEIIVSVLLRATRGDRNVIRKEVAHHIAHRKQSQPLMYPSAGSTFKNISVAMVSEHVKREFATSIKTDPFPVIPVARMLDRLGLKGTRIGGAEISTQHPNFFINRDHATSADIKALIALAKRKARRRYGVLLEEEIRIVP